MPRAKNPKEQIGTARRLTKKSLVTKRREFALEAVFLNVAISPRSRAALNKLVGAMAATSQRQVLEQLIADELHRRNLRLPRAV